MRLVIALVLIFPTVVFASKARLISLGESGTEGSHYIEDTRAVFLNPAYLNRHLNYLITEWGSGQTANSLDSDTTPRAEGGFFMSTENFVYGAYLGNLSKAHNAERSDNVGLTGVTTGDSNFLEQDNRTDLFFGGDAGILWGMRANYASAKDQNEAVDFEKEMKAYGLGLGILDDLYGISANVDLSDTSRGATTSADKWESKLGYEIGAHYNFSGVTLFGEYEFSGYEYTTETTRLENERTYYEVGFGRIILLNDKSKLFTRVNYANENGVYKGVGTTKVKSSFVPVSFGFEAEAKPWLTLRASVSQYLWQDNRISNKGVNTNSTVVNAGATLTVGRAKIDGLLGQDSSGNKEGTPGTFARVSASYYF